MIRFLLVYFFSFFALFAQDVCQIEDQFTYKNCQHNISVAYTSTFDTNHIPASTSFEHAAITSLGYQFYPVWTQLYLHNNTSHTQNLFLVNPRAGMDKIIVYIYKNGQLVFHDILGDTVSYETKSMQHRYSTIPLKLDANETVRIVSNVYNNGITELTWTAIRPTLFQNINENDMFLWGLFYGIVIAIVLYTMNSYLILKNKVYIFYFLIAVASSLRISSFNGMLYQFSPFLAFNNLMFWLFSPLLIIFMLLFSKYFFDTKNKMPKMNTLISISLFLLTIVTLIFVLGFVYPHNETLFVLKKYISISLIFYLVPIVIGLNAIRLKQQGALFYIIGQGFYSLAIGYQLLYNYTSDAFSFSTLYATLLGSLIDLVFLSFALGQFFRFLKEEKEHNEKLLIAQSSFSNIGKSLGHITHQWNHPIAQMGTSLALLETVYRHQSENFINTFKNQLPELKNYLTILESTLNDFSLAFKDTKNNHMFYVHTNVKRVENMLSSKLILKNINTTIDIDEKLKIFSNENIFFNLILILMDNSIDAFQTNSNNKIQIQATVDNGHMKIYFSDNAGGIKIHPIEDIFEYGVSTKDDDKPHGFGLSIVKLIVESKLSGSIKVQNTDEGTLFLIDYPIVD